MMGIPSLVLLDLSQEILLDRANSENVVRLYPAPNNLQSHLRVLLYNLIRTPITWWRGIRIELHIRVNELMSACDPKMEDEKKSGFRKCVINYYKISRHTQHARRSVVPMHFAHHERKVGMDTHM